MLLASQLWAVWSRRSCSDQGPFYMTLGTVGLPKLEYSTCPYRPPLYRYGGDDTSTSANPVQVERLANKNSLMHKYIMHGLLACCYWQTLYHVHPSWRIRPAESGTQHGLIPPPLWIPADEQMMKVAERWNERKRQHVSINAIDRAGNIPHACTVWRGLGLSMESPFRAWLPKMGDSGCRQLQDQASRAAWQCDNWSYRWVNVPR